MDNNYNQQPNPYMNNGYGNYGGPYNNGGNSEPQKAPNIIQQFVISFMPSQYSRLTNVTTGGMIGFVTLLSLVSSVIIFAFLLFFLKSINIREYIDQIPDFEIRGGQLNIEEDFRYDEAPIYLYITDDVNAFSYEDASELAAEGYKFIYLIGRDSLSIMQYTFMQTNAQYLQYDFSDFDSDKVIDKEWTVDVAISIMRVSFVMGFVIFFVGSIFWYFLCAAVYLLFAMFITNMMNKRLSTGTLFRIAVYSKVLMFVAMTFLNMIFFTGFLAFLFRVVVTVGFIRYAIAKFPEENWRY